MKTTKTLTPQKALNATKRTQYVTEDVLDTWPIATNTELEFFKADKYVSASDIEKEYESRGLMGAPFELCAYDLIHRTEMDDKKCVATQWRDAEGNFCYAAFSQWSDGERGVSVYRYVSEWNDRWWFAGVRKSSALTPESKPSDTQSLDLSRAVEMCKEAGYKVYKEL